MSAMSVDVGRGKGAHLGEKGRSAWISIWLTYACLDNEAKDVDFVIQELRREGLTAKLDRKQRKIGYRCIAWGINGR
jgi:hypothetical protein